MAIIDKSSDYFNTKLYSGNGGTNAQTGVNFQPDFTWIKARSNAENHNLFDSVRGVTKRIRSNGSEAEDTRTTSLTAFGTDGFTLGSGSQVNTNGWTFASWNWKAGTSFTNDASSTGIGTIDSAGSFNNDSGFSIVTYTGTGSNGTIKHGLSTAPKMVMVKSLGESESWNCYNANLTSPAYVVQLSTKGAQFSNGSTWNSTAPTSSVFSVGTDAGTNKNSINFIAYCFADVQGFSKMGLYVGNGNADGPFVYTGLKPAFVMTKKTSGTSQWVMFDNKRSPINYVQRRLQANNSAAENTDDNQDFDILSNGFKSRRAAGDWNSDGDTFIYMAFAENPFVTSTGNGSIPSPAR